MLSAFFSALRVVSDPRRPWLIYRSVLLEDPIRDEVFGSILSQSEHLLEENKDLFSAVDIVRLPEHVYGSINDDFSELVPSLVQNAMTDSYQELYFNSRESFALIHVEEAVAIIVEKA